MTIPALGILRQSFVRYVTDISKLGCNLTDKTEILPVLESISESVQVMDFFKYQDSNYWDHQNMELENEA